MWPEYLPVQKQWSMASFVSYHALITPHQQSTFRYMYTSKGPSIKDEPNLIEISPTKKSKQSIDQYKIKKHIRHGEKCRRLLWMVPKLSGIKSIAWQSSQQGCRLHRFCKIAPFMIRNTYVYLRPTYIWLCTYLEILKHCVSRWDQPSKIVTLAAKNIWYQSQG